LAASFLIPPTLGQVRAAARGNLLAESLSRRLGYPISVDVAPSYEELERCILMEEVELAWAPPSTCALAENKAPAIFKAVRGGQSTYRAAIVARRRDGMALEELGDYRAAWVDRRSTGGHLLARALLREHGIDTVAEETYHGDYASALLAVMLKRADFTSVYTKDESEAAARATLSEHIGPYETQFRVVAITDSSPSDGLIVTNRAPDVHTLIGAVAPFTATGRGDSTLLTMFDAESLELADTNDYWVVRQALVQQ